METPFYKVDINKIHDNYKILCDILNFATVYYATKPNFEEIIIKALVDKNASFEISSFNEMQALLDFGVSSEKIICSVPIKSCETIINLYQKGCRYFVFDSIVELEKLVIHAPDAKKIVRLYVADLIEGEIDLGMYEKDILSLVKNNEFFSKNIDGFTFYILNNQNKFDIFEQVFRRIEGILEILNKNNLIVNIGGNLPFPTNTNKSFFAMIEQWYRKFHDKYSVIFLSEPGRTILKDAITLHTKIILIKEKSDGCVVYIDASSQIVKLNPTGSITVNGGECKKNAVKTKYYFYESLCSHYLLFTREMEERLWIGDTLAIHNYGAYSSCFANHFHGLSIPKYVTESD